MELAIFVYLAGLVNSIGIAAFLITVVLSVATCVGVVAYADGYVSRGGFKSLISYLAISISVAVFTPSERTMYLMAGAYATQTIATSEVGQKVYKLVDQKLDEYLVETEKKSSK